jgi:glyoxylase-like metal-dependent hydrolase (beta-lactamase superfamily II)
MIFKKLVVGAFAVNCYILADSETKEGVVIDPGADTDLVISTIQCFDLKINSVLNTHGHFDHSGGNKKVAEATGAPIMVHKGDAFFLEQAASSAAAYNLEADNSKAARFLEDGMILHFGRQTLKVIHTPGHSQGGCCFYLEAEAKLISGDTLFEESIGRTDLPGGSADELIESIKGKLLVLPEDTEVFPGHGPSTTIFHEKNYNPYLRDIY